MAIQTMLCRGTARHLSANKLLPKGVSRCYSSGWSNELDWRAAAAAATTTTTMPPSSLPLPPLALKPSASASRKYYRRRCMSSTPFYGSPLPPSSRYTDGGTSSSSKDSTQQDKEQQQQQHTNHYLPPLSPLQRLTTLVHSSITALNDPTRADAVAAVGEVTGSYALSKMLAGMESNEVGRRILNDRPLVNNETVAKRAMELLRQHEEDEMSERNVNMHNPINSGRTKGLSFGAAYATFLRTHEFDPNDRSPVRFIPDPNLSYVMTRYRQCHDYWHVLTGLPPTVLGELALKWLELMQTGLPLAALSATGGALGASGLSVREREVLWEVYLPWAVRVGSGMKEHSLMCTYYEEELETDLGVLRERLGVEAAPVVEI